MLLPPRSSELLQSFEAKNYEGIAGLTLQVWRTAKSVPGLSLDAAFQTDKAAQQRLNAIFNEKLGIKIRIRVRGEERLVFSPEASSFFAMRPAARTNYAHLLKRCARIAAGLIDLKVEKARLADGSLRISGGDLSKEFGVGSLLLTERHTLKQRSPVSFSDIEAFAKAQRRKTDERRNNPLGRMTGTDSATALQTMAARIASLSRVKPDQVEALLILRKAVDAAIRRANPA